MQSFIGNHVFPETFHSLQQVIIPSWSSLRFDEKSRDEGVWIKGRELKVELHEISIIFVRFSSTEETVQREREREKKVMVEKVNRSSRRRISSASFKWNIYSKLWSQRQLVHQREELALGKFFEWGKLTNDRSSLDRGDDRVPSRPIILPKL